MSTVVFSRLVQPQFSFLFSNYSPSNVKTTMKAKIELDDLQLHPENMSFFLSAFGPLRLINGTLGHLTVTKSLTSADTIPIRIEVNNLTVNLELLSSPIEYDLSNIPRLTHPAENIEAELDTCEIKVDQMKINLKISEKYSILLQFSDFSLYGTTDHFFISTPGDLRQLIRDSGFAYNEFFIKLDKFSIIEHKPNFDEIIGIVIEKTQFLGRSSIKKRNKNQSYNTCEFDLFVRNDMTLSLTKELFVALTEIKSTIHNCYNSYDIQKHMLDVVNQVPAMIWYVTRLTIHFPNIQLHCLATTNSFNSLFGIQTDHQPDEDLIIDLTMKKGLSLSTYFYPDCIYITRNILVFPVLQLFLNGEEFINAQAGQRTLKIPHNDSINRTYLNPHHFFFLAERLSNCKDAIEQTSLTIPGKLVINTTIGFFEHLKNPILNFFSNKTAGDQISGLAFSTEIIFHSSHKQDTENQTKMSVSMKNVNFDFKQDGGGSVIVQTNSGQMSLAPYGLDDYNTVITSKECQFKAILHELFAPH